ncbi:MAG TPA: PQQ-binding-like beta-propeller repeat protein, partial [Gemmataceae bacterium]|nr:PQQ-binding-like beta-propeller repeat protein [Gemmataceae bacterium]
MSTWHLRILAVMIVAPTLLTVCTASASDAPKEKQPRRDLFGDPLPPGAIARLGTMRLRYAACMAFSPDGKVVATAQGRTVHLWEAATGKQMRRFSTPPSMGWAHTVAFSPDGRIVAVLDNLGIDVAVWKVDKEGPLFTAHIKRQGGVHQLVMERIVFSPDSKTLYTGNDRTVHAWDAATGKEIYRFQHGKPNETRTNTIVFSRDGKLFATASDTEFGARLWDAHSGKLLHHLLYPAGGRGGQYCAAFSPDGTLLATGGSGNYLWDVKSGKEIRRLGVASIAVAFTPDGKGLATAHRPAFLGVATIRLWDLKAGAEKPRKTIAAPDIKALEYSPDGKTLAWICCNQSVRLLDAKTGEERILFDSHYGDVNSVAYSPDGRLIATASSDHTIRLWYADTSKPKGVLRGHTNAVNAVAFSPDGKWLASGSNDGTGILWDVEKQKIRFPCKDHGAHVCAAAFTPEGRTLLIGGYHWQSWDVRTGKELPINRENCKSITSLAFSPDGTLLATGEHNSSARVYDSRNGRLLRTVKTEPWVTSVTFSPDGR